MTRENEFSKNGPKKISTFLGSVTYEEWLKRQNRRWKGKRYRKHLSVADIDRRTAKAIEFLDAHGR
jgi:hypothetical protein